MSLISTLFLVLLAVLMLILLIPLLLFKIIGSRLSGKRWGNINVKRGGRRGPQAGYGDVYLSKDDYEHKEKIVGDNIGEYIEYEEIKEKDENI